MEEEIKFEDLPLQDYFSKELKSLLTGLTCKNPRERLGYSSQGGGIAGLKKHAFFKGVEWDKLKDK